MKIACLAVLALSTTAHADPHFEVLDRGDAVEVIGHDITTARTNITAARSRLEIPLPPGAMPVVKRVVPGDATVLLAEIDPDAHAVSVKLTLDHIGTVALARVSQAMQIGNDIHVLIARKAEGVTLPEPTLPGVPVPLALTRPEAGSGKPEAGTAKPEAAKPEAAKPEAVKPEAVKPDAVKPEAVKPEAASPTLEAGTAKSGPEPLASSLADDGSPVSPSVLVGAALLACAAGVWLWKRRKHVAAPVAAIDVIAQRALGGKARIVWLAVGRRELVVAVTQQQIQMLGSWPRGESVELSVVVPAATALPVVSVAPPIAPEIPEMPAIPRTRSRMGSERGDASGTSPSVNGILKLRERTAPPLADDIATGDPEADAVWTRELLAATVAGRR